jgi:hypothetical protein
MASQTDENKGKDKDARKQQKEKFKWYFKHCLKYQQKH